MAENDIQHTNAMKTLFSILGITYGTNVAVNPNDVKIADDGRILVNVHGITQQLGIGIDEFKRTINNKFLFYSRQEQT